MAEQQEQKYHHHQQQPPVQEFSVTGSGMMVNFDVQELIMTVPIPTTARRVYNGVGFVYMNLSMLIFLTSFPFQY